MTIFLEAISVAHLVCMGFHMRYNNIGLKHDFLCFDIWLAPKVALNHESVKQGFSEPQGAYKMFM